MMYYQCFSLAHSNSSGARNLAVLQLSRQQQQQRMMASFNGHAAGFCAGDCSSPAADHPGGLVSGHNASSSSSSIGTG